MDNVPCWHFSIPGRGLKSALGRTNGGVHNLAHFDGIL
jgi:hypothetical protein